MEWVFQMRAITIVVFCVLGYTLGQHRPLSLNVEVSLTQDSLLSQSEISSEGRRLVKIVK